MNPLLQERGFDVVDGVFGDETLLRSYEECPLDPFIGNGTRYKRFSQYKVAHTKGQWQLELLPPRAYVAPRQYNPIGGGFYRPYEPLVANFKPLLLVLLEKIGLDRSTAWQINVHQNRSVATAEKPGELTPEGRHRDGHELVSISVLARSSMNGGLSRVWSDEEARTPLWESVMTPGQTLLLDDRAVLHDVTDVLSAGDSRTTRDILIVAYSRWKERWYGDAHDSSALDARAAEVP